MISSTSNKKIKDLQALMKKSSLRQKEKKFVAEGIKIFSEIESDIISICFISENLYKNLNSELKEKLLKTDFEIVSDKVFESISDTKTPQGIMLVCRQYESDLDDILKKNELTVVILETIQDPGNLGTILRSAEAAGADAVIADKNTVDVYNPKVVRSTLGAISRLNFIVVDELMETVDKLKNNGIKIYAAHLSSDIFYDEIKYDKKSAILIGNESKGLTKKLTDKADEKVKIPIHGKAESLNAAVAASILMYEIERQKRG